MDKEKKAGIITNFAHHEKDTGSTEVQVAVLTARISQLTGHMVANRHDYQAQRRLLILVGKRRRLLTYLNKQDVGQYRDLIGKLGLRK